MFVVCCCGLFIDVMILVSCGSRYLVCLMFVFDNGISVVEDGFFFFLIIIIGCARGVKLLVWSQYTIFDII